MNIKIEGKVPEHIINDLMSFTSLNLVLESKVNEKIDSILNKHFNHDIATQSIRENFNKSINRYSNTDEFKDLFKECLYEKIKLILDSKDFSKIIDQSCKSYIDNVIKTIKS